MCICLIDRYHDAPTVSRVAAAELRNKPQVHMHISAGDGARSGPRETARCVAFAFIDLRPLAAVLQIHLLLLLSHTYEIRVDIRDEIRNGAKFLPEGFFQVETVVLCYQESRNCLDFYHCTITLFAIVWKTNIY